MSRLVSVEVHSIVEELPNVVRVMIDQQQPPELAVHIESMEWHKLACEPDF